MTVHVHDLVHQLVTGQGTRPRPNGDGAVPAPVVVALYRPGEAEPFAHVPADGWVFHPHRAATGNSPEAPAELVIGAVLPPEADR